MSGRDINTLSFFLTSSLEDWRLTQISWSWSRWNFFSIRSKNNKHVSYPYSVSLISHVVIFFVPHFEWDVSSHPGLRCGLGPIDYTFIVEYKVREFETLLVFRTCDKRVLKWNCVFVVNPYSDCRETIVLARISKCCWGLYKSCACVRRFNCTVRSNRQIYRE